MLQRDVDSIYEHKGEGGISAPQSNICVAGELCKYVFTKIRPVQTNQPEPALHKCYINIFKVKTLSVIISILQTTIK